MIAASPVTAPQAISFAIVVAAMALFAWGRLRYDLVSMSALLVAALTGVVPAKAMFSGFSSDVVVIIAAALVVSAAIARSGAVEPLFAPLVARFTRPATQVPVLAGLTAAFSLVSKNVGALATLMPLAVRMGREEGSSPSLLLMPMSFLSLLGGLATLYGTSTNIIVSQVREDMLGKPFRVFDFAPVGLALTLIGLAVVSVAWRLLPRGRVPQAELGETQAEVEYASEALVPEDWPETLATVADLDLAGRNVTLTGLRDAEGKPRCPAAATPIAPGMLLLLKGSSEALGNAMRQLPLTGAREAMPLAKRTASDELRAIEAVIEPDSRLVGASATSAQLEGRSGVRLLAISRQGRTLRGTMAEMTLAGGDMVILQARETGLGEALRDLGLLPLAERNVAIGDARRRIMPLLVLGVALALVVANVVPVAEAFFGAAVAVVALGALPMREAYRALEPEVLVLIGALTPIGEAMQHNGATALLAGVLTTTLHGAPPLLLLGGVMAVAMACAPFLHNAPTVLILAPVALTMAKGLGLSPDAFLMAVATGAGSDFLTPIGHQCNTLVRGPGGYHFGDYARLGAPLSLAVLGIGTPLIAWVWHLTG